MLQIFLAIFLGLACPNHTNHHGTTVSTLDTGTPPPPPDTGGEGGHFPPNPTPPPPPKGGQ